jgi:hypothetical protein
MNDVLIFKVNSVSRTQEQIGVLITQIDAIISFLLTNAIEAIGTGGVAKYKLNTGQTQQEVEYKTTDDVMLAVKNWERLRDYYEAKTTSRITRLMDEKNFRIRR